MNDRLCAVCMNFQNINEIVCAVVGEIAHAESALFTTA